MTEVEVKLRIKKADGTDLATADIVVFSLVTYVIPWTFYGYFFQPIFSGPKFIQDSKKKICLKAENVICPPKTAIFYYSIVFKTMNIV